MKKNMLLLLVFVSAFILGACTAQVMEEEAQEQELLEQSFANFDYECTATELENQACTREYMPVCGNDNQTHANGCTACATEGVYAYNYGECESDRAPIFDEDACGASTLQEYVGLSIEEMDVASYSELYRVIRPGDAVTMDYRVERLNVNLDESDIIEMITCG